MPSPTRPLEERFWEKVRKTEGCWLWTASTAEFGYGAIGAGGKHGKILRAHRVSYEIANGPIPAGLCVLHRCDNPGCVNPDHLFLGTNQDNHKDMIEKGRNSHRALHGENSHRSKLTLVQVEEIRTYVSREVHRRGAQREMAIKFGVTDATISLIVKNQTWNNKDLKDHEDQ